MKPLVNGTETEANAKTANQKANFGACFANPPKSAKFLVAVLRSVIDDLNHASRQCIEIPGHDCSSN